MRNFTIAFATTLMLALGLAGCVEPQEPEPAMEADAVVRIPAGAYDEAGGGPWYTWDGPIAAPAVVRFVNDDSVWHRILILEGPAQEAPAWAKADEGHSGHDHGGHGTGDASGGHEHGGAAGAVPLADFDLQAGEETTITLEASGRFVVHCHPHPWMEAILDVGGEDQGFAVVPQILVKTSAKDAVTQEAETSSAMIDVDWPNLVSLDVNVTWDDAADDAVAGYGQTNGADTLRARLLKPDGTVVAEREATARQGLIHLRYDQALDWPDEVQAASRDHAVAALREAASDDLQHSGTWRLEVEVVASPGVLPAEVSDVSQGVDDGGQSWKATIKLSHAWAKLV